MSVHIHREEFERALRGAWWEGQAVVKDDDGIVLKAPDGKVRTRGANPGGRAGQAGPLPAGPFRPAPISC